MIPAQHLRHRRQRIRLSEASIRHRDRDLIHCVREHHVAKVDDAGNPLAIHNHVEVVCIVVDHAASQGRPHRRHVLLINTNQARHAISHSGIRYQRQVLVHHAKRTRQVPVKFAMNRSRVKPRQTPAQPSQRRTK